MIRLFVLAMILFAAALIACPTPASAAARAVSGVYTIHDGADELGREEWSLTTFGDGTMLLQINLKLTTRQIASVDLTADWRIKSLTLLVADGTNLSYAHYICRENALQGCRVALGGLEEISLTLQPGYQLDFGSPWFNAIVTQNLKLQSGGSADYEVVNFELPSMLPYKGQHSLTRLDDETADVAVFSGTRACERYVVDIVGPASAMATSFLLSPEGIPVRFGTDEQHPDGWYRLDELYYTALD